MSVLPPLLGIVIKANGMVSFDEPVDPSVRAQVLQWLTDNGHIYEPIVGTKHVRITNWKVKK